MEVQEKKQVNMREGTRILLFAVAANLLMQLFIGIVQVVVGKGTGRNPANSDYFQLVSMLLLQVAFVAVPLIYYFAFKKQTPVLKYPLASGASSALGLVLAPLTIFAFFFPAQLFAMLLEKIGYTFAAGVNFDTAGKLVFGIVVMVLVAPCVEELIFRGFLLSGLRDSFGKWRAALLCGLAFSLMHMNPEQTVYQFFLGVVCALAVMESGTLLTGVVTHAASNLLAILLDVTPLGSKVYYRFAGFVLKDAGRACIGTLLCAAVGCALIWLLLRAVRKRKAAAADAALPLVATEKGSVSPYVVTCVICAVMWAVVFAGSV